MMISVLVIETLTLTVSDTAGNSVTDTVSISIRVDDQNPSISSFATNDTGELTTSSQSQTVVFTVAASDNVAVDISILEPQRFCQWIIHSVKHIVRQL